MCLYPLSKRLSSVLNECCVEKQEKRSIQATTTDLTDVDGDDEEDTQKTTMLINIHQNDTNAIQY